jgi:hypothetical protein
MALRVIWQYMDRSVTKKILYGPKLHELFAILYFLSKIIMFIWPVHIISNISIQFIHFTFLFPLFVFVSAAGHYFRIWTETWVFGYFIIFIHLHLTVDKQ